MRTCFSSLHSCLATSSNALTNSHLDAKAPPTLSPAIVEEGTALVEELLKTWSSTSSTSSALAGSDEDVEMADDAEDDAEAQLATLRRCVEQFRPRLEGNAWVQQVLASLA